MAGFILPPPQDQWIDADGEPYAGGTVETYIPGTTTPKNTWKDEGETVLNTNPIILDAAGRATIWGTGDYRFIVRDNTGQLVYDGISSVVDLSGYVTTAALNAAVQAETNRAEAAEANLQSQITAEVARAEAAENTLTTNLNAEIARAEAAEAHLQSEITALTTGQKVQAGTGLANSSGIASVTFPTAYTGTPVVTATTWGSALSDEWISITPTSTGFTAYCSQPLSGSTIGGAPIGFMWIAVGV